MPDERRDLRGAILAGLLLTAALALASCKIPTEYIVRAADVPYCPVDSAGWVAADSVPLGCGRPW